MEVKVTTSNNKVSVFQCNAHSAIDKFVDAIKENMPTWTKIEIIITNS